MITLTKVLYTAVATAEGGRDGHTATDDGRLDVQVTPPPELGGEEHEHEPREHEADAGCDVAGVMGARVGRRPRGVRGTGARRRAGDDADGEEDDGSDSGQRRPAKHSSW